MSTLLSFVTTIVALVVGVLAGRRGVTRRVASRQVGVPVELATMQLVLDTGDDLWRGPAPTLAGYQELAAAGCSLIVDLRAEADLDRAASQAAAAGLELLIMPTKNTRTPAESHVDDLASAHESTAGATYVHCEAGEGRTGALIGAYQVRQGVSPRTAVADALAVGSLTFSQLAYIASGARAPVFVKMLDLGLDRPTEAGFDLVDRSRRSSDD